MHWYYVILKVSFFLLLCIHNVSNGFLHLMYWFYVFMEKLFTKECGSTVWVICAWEFLSFMHCFYVSLKVSFIRCFVFTMWAWVLLAFMHCFYVYLKASFLSECGSATWAWNFYTLMDRFYVSLKVHFLFCFVFTLQTMISSLKHLQDWWLELWRAEFGSA